jgi:hypothetical protein
MLLRTASHNPVSDYVTQNSISYNPVSDYATQNSIS